jgi:hypothetical protein
MTNHANEQQGKGPRSSSGEQPSRRVADGELGRFEPVSDGLILAAVQRAERHRHGEPEQAKALLAILIADLRANSRAEVLPTYRVGAPVVCAPTNSVGETARRANHVVLAPALDLG